MFPKMTFVIGKFLTFPFPSLPWCYLLIWKNNHIGNGHEFRELGAQYGVRSFPKLLLFKRGILKGKHNRKHNAADLAGQIVKWTGLLPRAIPIARKVPSKAKNKDRKTSLWTIINDIFSGRNSSELKNEILQFIDIGPSVEPVAVSYEYLVKWDTAIFIISGVYTIGRFFHKFIIFSRNLD